MAYIQIIVAVNLTNTTGNGPDLPLYFRIVGHILPDMSNGW